jgi:hypothetical protein
MAEYDNSNTGAAFTPFPSQQMILQGKINVDGTDSKIVLVKDETRDGRQIIEVYQKMGTFFENDKKSNPAAPDYSGPLGDAKRIAGWRKMKDNKPYMSFQISDKTDGAQGQQGESNPLQSDAIPF